MTESINNLQKGIYVHPQPTGFLVLKEYIISGKKENKRLLLRFYNEASFAITNINLTIFMTDTSGKKKSRIRVSERFARISPGEHYVLEKAIKIEEDCADFTVNVTAFDSGVYRYKLHNGQYNVFFMARRERRSRKTAYVGARTNSIKRPSTKFTAFIATASLIAIFVSCFIIRIKLEQERINSGAITYSAGDDISTANYCIHFGECDVEI